MRRYINIVTVDEPWTDEIGSEFADEASARDAAIRTAREIMADRLRTGRPVFADGYVEILDDWRQIRDAIPLHTIAFGRAGSLRHSQLYAMVNQSYLLLTPDFSILEANPAFLKATMTDLAAIRYRAMFDIFPDNPSDPEANGVRNLTASLHTVLSTKQPHVMARQRYDIRRRDGTWEKRVWLPTNYPVLDDNGEVEFLIHHVEDVTAFAA